MTSDRSRRLDRLAGLRGAPRRNISWIRIVYVSNDAPSPEIRRAHAFVKATAAGLAAAADVGRWERRPDEAEAAFVARVETEINRVAAGRQVFVTAET